MASNQRAHVRYTPNCDAFISLGPGFTCVGSVRDISLSGASFEYFPYNQIVPPVDDSVDIFVCRSDMHIMDIPCRKVYELAAPEKNRGLPPGSTMVQKRCGIEFQPAHSHHQEQLERFLSLYIQSPVSTQD